MDVTLSPRGQGPALSAVTAPSSKSFVHRQLIAAALSEAPTEVFFRGFSQDIAASAACIQALGGGCSLLPPGADGFGCLRVRPVRRGALPQTPLLDAGESGSTARFFLPVAAALYAADGAADGFSLTGHGRLPQRPMGDLCRALRAHGCRVSADALPLQAVGPLCGGEWLLPGNVSSQYITGLLLALPLLTQDSTLRLTTPPVSAAYLTITLEVLAQFGVRVQPTENGWQIPGGQQYVSPGRLTAEGDWSNAAFWLAADAIVRAQGGPGVTVQGLRPDSVQGDRAVTQAIAAITAPGDTVLDIDPIPDLMPVLAVLAAGQRKKTVFANAARLRLKESDRLAATCAALRALGGQADAGAASLTVTGTGALVGGTVDGAGDHRIVMAAAVASLLCRAPVTVCGAQAVEKSYPDFWDDWNAWQRGERAVKR